MLQYFYFLAFIYLAYCSIKLVSLLFLSGRGLDRFKDSFNYWLSHSHQTIEHAFGILTQCWGILWCPFSFSLHRWSTVAMVCMKLHNLCIDRNIVLPTGRFYQEQENVVNGQCMIMPMRMIYFFMVELQEIVGGILLQN